MQEYEKAVPKKQDKQADDVKGNGGKHLQDDRKMGKPAALQLKKSTIDSGAGVAQLMFGSGKGFSFGADTGADNGAEFYLEDQRRQARARREAERRREEARQQKIAAVWQQYTQYKYQLSGNAPAVKQELERLIEAGLPEDKTASKIVTDAIAEVLGTTSGSYAADREDHGAHYRR